MASDLLRHYALGALNSGASTAVTPVLATNRALVGKLLLSVVDTGGCQVVWYIGPTGGTYEIGGYMLQLDFGSVYTEPQLVIPGGERLWIYYQGNAVNNIVRAHFYGVETDNI